MVVHEYRKSLKQLTQGGHQSILKQIPCSNDWYRGPKLLGEEYSSGYNSYTVKEETIYGESNCTVRFDHE